MTLHLVSLKMFVTLKNLSTICSSVISLFLSSSRILIRLSWRWTSYSTTSETSSSSWSPLISIRAPFGIEMLMSCRIEPSPRMTLPVPLSVLPIARATSSASFGDFMTGAVATSMSGIPRRSIRYFIVFPSFSPVLGFQHGILLPTRDSAVR